MSAAPFLASPPLIQLHAIAALAALFLGAYEMLRRKGTKAHKTFGWVWVALMAVVAVSSIGIVSFRPLIGPFGWIHALSALTLLTLPIAVLHARAGRIAKHRQLMITLFFAALVVAGLFTLAPGRLMHQVVFGN